MKYFNGIVCGSEVEHGKPAPDIFLKACDKLNVEPEEVHFVLEDSEAGIQAASEAKIFICILDMKFSRKYQKKS